MVHLCTLAELSFCCVLGGACPPHQDPGGQERRKSTPTNTFPARLVRCRLGTDLNSGSLRPKPCPLHSTCCLSAKLAAGTAREPQVVSLCNCPQATQPEFSSLWDEQTSHHIADLRRRCCPWFPSPPVRVYHPCKLHPHHSGHRSWFANTIPALRASLMGSAGRESACNVEGLGWEDPQEKGKAAHSSILAWRIPWTI